jgi:dihydrofolate reductase
VRSGDDRPFADTLNAIPKIVFSKTLQRAPWGSWPEARIVRGSAAEEVAGLRAGAGKDMVLWGSLSLARSLLEAGQVDECQLIVCPLVLGNGKPLFRSGAKMRLSSMQSFDRGTVVLTYEPATGRLP